MIYKIEHGSIAAIQFVTMPNGKKITVSDSKDEPNLRYLPLEVKEIINRQFGIVFLSHMTVERNLYKIQFLLKLTFSKRAFVGVIPQKINGR